MHRHGVESEQAEGDEDGDGARGGVMRAGKAESEFVHERK